MSTDPGPSSRRRADARCTTSLPDEAVAITAGRPPSGRRRSLTATGSPIRGVGVRTSTKTENGIEVLEPGVVEAEKRFRDLLGAQPAADEVTSNALFSWELTT